MKKKLMIIGLSCVMCLAITACASSDYENAVELQNKGEYQKALNLYNGISGYKDSSDKIKECENMLTAIEVYNTAKTAAEEKNASLLTAISEAEAVIAEEKEALDDSLISKLEASISNAKAVKIDVPEIPQTADEINATAETLKTIDYADAISELSQNQMNLEKSIKQYDLVNSPSEEYIIQCLKQVKTVKDILAVTEDNDPNGNLNKDGGYTAQIYFSSKDVDQSQFSERTVIDKGTDCGGSIEVYANEEDAKERDIYLAAFDGSIFASGSHKVIGTCVVRTSNELTASKQKELEKQIITQLTKISE